MDRPRIIKVEESDIMGYTGNTKYFYSLNKAKKYFKKLYKQYIPDAADDYECTNQKQSVMWNKIISKGRKKDVSIEYWTSYETDCGTEHDTTIVFITLEELFKTFDPMVVRYFILQFHYRKPVDFSFDAIKNIESQYNKIKETFNKISALASNEKTEILDENLKEVKQNFENAMDDDFNTPVALAEMLRFSKIASKIVEEKNENLAKQANSLVKIFADVLGFNFEDSSEKQSNENSQDKSEKLLELISSVRDKLRASKNYEMSDYIRDELNKLDINISDKKI